MQETEIKKPYHYRECGLDNVYLLDGYEIFDHPEHGRGVSFRNIDGLHEAIGRFLCEHDSALDRKEFKFLRKEMELTQKELADLLHLDTQTIARYEKGETAISGPVDRLIRLIYLDYVNKEQDCIYTRDVLDRLAKMDYCEPNPLNFTFDELERWHPTRTAA